MVEAEYAKAIYELALENNKVELYSQYFQVFDTQLEDKEFYNTLTSPSIGAEVKKNIISKAFVAFDEDFVNFIKVIIDHNRISKFSYIFEEYIKLANEALGVVDVLIVSAEELSSKENTAIEKSLVKRFEGKRINIKNMIDPNLLGGVKVICNGEALDISLKNSLDKLKESLF